MSRPESRRIRVAVVDDHPLICDGVRRAVEGAPDCEFVGEARSVSDARVMLSKERPDVVLLDCRLPDGSGVGLIPELDGGPTRVVVLTCATDEAQVREAIEAGAAGFVSKQAADNTLILDAVRNAFQGLRVMSPDALTSLLGTTHRDISLPGGVPTARERQVWRLVGEGRTNAEVASALFLSERTVKFHVSNLLRKTGARTRAEVTALAYRSGLMGERPPQV